MFHFLLTLNDADEYLAKGDIALAVFNYWLVNFAFEDEEFPYLYTDEIGSKAERKYNMLLRKHKHEILTSDSYKKYKESLSNSDTYKNYFSHFENDIKNYKR